MCSAYADCGLLYLMYLMCSLYLISIEPSVWPMYTLLHVLHSSLYIPLGVCPIGVFFWQLLLDSVSCLESYDYIRVFKQVCYSSDHRTKVRECGPFFLLFFSLFLCFIVVFPVCMLFSYEIAEELNKIKVNENSRIITLDIKELYVNLPLKESCRQLNTG